MGPKLTGTPGQTPSAVDAAAEDAKPAKKVAAKRDDSGAETVTRDLTKKPKSDERPMITLKTPDIEAPNDEEALAMANVKGRAVFCPTGWVCPSVSHERRAA